VHAVGNLGLREAQAAAHFREPVSTVCGDEVVSAFLDLTPIVGVGKELIQKLSRS
jgi:hypothetical protein